MLTMEDTVQVDDLVKHKRLGQGRVLGFTLYGDRGRYVKVAFDGVETPKLISETRLRVIPKPREGPLPEVPRRYDKSVDYATLTRAETEFRAQYPDADDVKAFPYAKHIVVEVWKNGRADVFRYRGRAL